MRRQRTPALTLVALLAVAGCTSPTTSPSASGPSASGTTSVSGTPSPAASSVTPFYSPTPLQTPSGAPSTSGNLTQASFVVPTGWKPVVTNTSEQGLTPNGVPVHARNPAEVSATMLQPCAAPPSKAPTNPAHVLEMNLKRGTSLGVAELLDFDTTAHAQQWFATFRAQVSACVRTQPSVFTRLQSDATTWRGRRNLGSDGNYAEVAVLTGRRISSYALQDPQRTFDGVQLVRALRKAG